MTLGHSLWQRRGRNPAAQLAGKVQTLILVYLGPNRGELINVMADRPGGLRGGQVCLAVVTVSRTDQVELIYMLGHDGLMRGMTGLATALATLTALGLGRTSAGQVRRRRLGGILRIFGQLRLELDDLGAGRCQLGARDRKLALQCGHQSKQLLICRLCRDLMSKVPPQRMSSGPVNDYRSPSGCASSAHDRGHLPVRSARAMKVCR